MTNGLRNIRQGPHQVNQGDAADRTIDVEEGDNTRSKVKENDWRAEYFQNWKK